MRCNLLIGLLFTSVCSFSCGTTEPSGQLKNGSFVTELNGFRIHYEIYGTGPVLMTLPNSWGINATTLRNLYKGLEDSLTLVYFDPRGMGESEVIREESDMGLAAVRADFDALREHLGLGKVAAIGWSNGAMNLIHLASERSETLSQAIFLHGAASNSTEDTARFTAEHPELTEAYDAYQKQTQDSGLSDNERNELLREFWLSWLLPLTCADPDAGRVFVRELFEELTFNWKHVRYSDQESSQYDERKRLPMITAHSLIIHGAEDLIDLRKAEDLRDGIPDAKLVVFEESGHFSPLEESEAFRQIVLDFLLD